MTGIKSPFTSMFSRSMLTPVTSPTWPISMISGWVISGVCRVTVSFLARISCASLPVRPMALPPCWLIRLTMLLLTWPPRTISTTSMVAVSVTRMPSTKWLSMLRRLSRSPICGPPPWTTTGLMPTAFISTMSRAKPCLSSSLSMALPPYLITSVLPTKRRIYGSASDSTLATLVAASRSRVMQGSSRKYSNQSERQVEVGHRAIELGAEDFLDPFKFLLGFRLEAQYQHRRGVGRAHQAPAFGVVDAYAIEVGDIAFTPYTIALQAYASTTPKAG